MLRGESGFLANIRTCFCPEHCLLVLLKWSPNTKKFQKRVTQLSGEDHHKIRKLGLEL